MDAPTTATEPEMGAASRARALEILKTYGYASNGFQALESGYQYWFFEHADGSVFIPYVPVRGYAVIPGGPVGPRGAVGAALNAFKNVADAEGRRLLIIGAEPWLCTCIEEQSEAYDFVKLGEQPEWDPSTFTIDGPDRRNVRAQINRARNKGVVVRRVRVDELERSRGAARLAIEHILGRWLDSRRIGVLRFMVDLEPFSFATERRYYVAERGDELVGFLSAVPVYSRAGWFFEDVIRVPNAPNGTAELLIYEAMEDARRHGDEYVTLGLSPLAGIEEGPGDHRLLRWGLRQLAQRFGALYGFEGLRQFKGRFGPNQWTPQYAIVPRGHAGLSAVWALFSAFVPGSMAAFAYDSFKRLLGQVTGRVWASVLVLQLACLVPWTVLLAHIDGQRWFGDPSIQAAWVAFDTTMALGLGALALLLWRGHPWSRRVSMFLAGTTLTDFVLSLVQAIQLHSAVQGWALLFVTMGVVGPAIATVFLWMIAVSRKGARP